MTTVQKILFTTLAFSFLAFAGGTDNEVVWSKDGKCYETNAAGQMLRESTYDVCRNAHGTQYEWKKNACWELTPKGHDIRIVNNDFCSGA